MYRGRETQRRMKIEGRNAQIPIVPNLSRLGAEPRRAGFVILFIKTPLQMVLGSFQCFVVRKDFQGKNCIACRE